MRLPLIPVVTLLVLAAGALTLFLLTPPIDHSLKAPAGRPVLDVEGVETEVAVAPDGQRYALIASGDLWFVDLATQRRTRLTETPAVETAPAWTPDGRQITFTRGDDTLQTDPELPDEMLRFPNARDLIWSPTGGIAFVRDRALWTAGPGGSPLRELVPADPRPDMTIRSPRFSPSGNQIVFVRSALDLYGEVWRVELESGSAWAVVADRRAENPASAEWIGDDQHLVYLTDRSGGLAVWYVDLAASSLVPLTESLMGDPGTPLGLDVFENTILLPRHAVDSNIRTTDGTLALATPLPGMEPALAPDGKRIVYTVENGEALEIWIADVPGGNARFLGLGRHPRFSPGGREVVYAATSLKGNRDIWKADLTTGFQESLTVGDAIDDLPDWSPDGRTIVFSSDRSGTLGLWSVPSSGGRPRQLREAGYGARFSPDGTRIAFWAQEAVWTADPNGSNAIRVAPARTATVPVWGPEGVAFYQDGQIQRPALPALALDMRPEFDRTPDGGWLVSSTRVRRSELWSLDLTFTEE